jgi:polysaccharide export outer membrane protein
VFGYVNGSTGSGGSSLSVVPGVTIQGSVGTNIQMTSPKPLLTVLAMAGGLSDRASRTITIQRQDPNAKPFKVFVPNDLAPAAPGSAEDPFIYPGDTLIVPRAGNVYILGNVGHPVGVSMAEDGKISLMEALTQAGSTMPTSSLSKLMLFRKTAGQYQAVNIRFDHMVKGQIPDIPLQAEDVVWVPFSYGRNILVNGASIAAALGSATASSIIYTH